MDFHLIADVVISRTRACRRQHLACADTGVVGDDTSTGSHGFGAICLLNIDTQCDDAKALRALLIGDATRRLVQWHGAYMQLLYLIYRTDGQTRLVRDCQTETRGNVRTMGSERSEEVSPFIGHLSL